MVTRLVSVLLLAPWLVAAQAPAPAPGRADPLMNLLMSQPKTDIPTNVVATAEFDPAIVRPGDLAVYRVTFNALDESVQWPETVPAPAGLAWRAGGRAQAMQYSGVGFAPRTCINYHARATRPGEYLIPALTVQVYGHPVVVPAARLIVTTSTPPGAGQADRAILELSSTNLFVGQPAKVRVMLPPSALGQVQTLSQVQVEGEGFFVDQGNVRQQIVPIQREGRTVAAFVYDTTLTPLKSGALTITAQGFMAALRMRPVPGVPGGPFPGMPQLMLVDSEPVVLQVRSLPREGELPGFTGAIGHLSLDPPRVAPGVARVGDAIKLSVTVRGDASLSRIPAPPPPTAAEWQIFSGTAEAPPPAPVIVRQGGMVNAAPPAEVTFSYTLIPLADSIRATPVIPFSYFDPVRSAYVPLPIPSVPVTVGSSSVPINTALVAKADSSPAGAEREPVLGELAKSPGGGGSNLRPIELRQWFPLLQGAPALVFVALWWWDRRRRYLERHPEIMLRRQARRGLRRLRGVMRRAARAGDAPGFAAAVTQALRVACAPHLPADPDALVGADVLAGLPARKAAAPTTASAWDLPAWPDVAAAGPGAAPDPRMAELVRRFFAVADGLRFGGSAGDAKPLLALEGDLDRLLGEMEVRLCD